MYIISAGRSAASTAARAAQQQRLASLSANEAGLSTMTTKQNAIEVARDSDDPRRDLTSLIVAAELLAAEKAEQTRLAAAAAKAQQEATAKAKAGRLATEQAAR